MHSFALPSLFLSVIVSVAFVAIILFLLCICCVVPAILVAYEDESSRVKVDAGADAQFLNESRLKRSVAAMRRRRMRFYIVCIVVTRRCGVHTMGWVGMAVGIVLHAL